MKIICSIIFFIFSFLAINAQTRNSFIMLNYNLSHQDGYLETFYSSDGFIGSNKVFPIGLLYVKSVHKNSSLRYGLSLFQRNLFADYISYTSIDSSFSSYTSYDLAIPKLSFGKEWQKHIHNNVDLYGGADIGFGLMNSFKIKHTVRSGGSLSQGGSTRTDPTLFYNITARPFTGIRFHWRSVAISYEASLPFNYIQALNEALKSLEKPMFQHQVSIGYRLGNLKKKKE
jgi:hypothetical protein